MSDYPKIRLFVEAPLHAGKDITLDGDRLHYLQHVMRVSRGDVVALFNGRDGEWRGEVHELHKKYGSIRVGEKLREQSAVPDVWALFAPIKFGRIDYLAQKATELGAAKLWPILTAYTQMDRVNTDRLRANVVEAAEQCGGMDVPVVEEPVKLPNLLAGWPKDRVLLYGDETGAGESANATLSQLKTSSWAVLVGPEGGFSPEELKMLKSCPYAKAVSLGPRILRADTALTTLLSVSQAWLGDWQRKPDFKGNA